MLKEEQDAATDSSARDDGDANAAASASEMRVTIAPSAPEAIGIDVLDETKKKKSDKDKKRFRAVSFEQHLVEGTLAVLAVVAVVTVVICAAFIACRGTTPAAAMCKGGQNASGHAPFVVEPLMFRMLPPLDRHVVKAMKPLCASHALALPLAFAAFCGFGLAYLVSGGCPGTACARIRCLAATVARILSGVGTTLAALGLTWIMIVGDLCAYGHRNCVEDTDEFPFSKNLPLVMCVAIVVLAASFCYLRFAINECIESKANKKTRHHAD